MTGRPKRLQFEWNLLVLVTAALVLFGLVMVYSATSGSAALGDRNPLGYVERQIVYVVLGVVLLVVVSRLELERLRALAPTLVVTALVLCLAVLAIGSRVNGARRWLAFGPFLIWPQMAVCGVPAAAVCAVAAAIAAAAAAHTSLICISFAPFES